MRLLNSTSYYSLRRRGVLLFFYGAGVDGCLLVYSLIPCGVFSFCDGRSLGCDGFCCVVVTACGVSCLEFAL